MAVKTEPRPVQARRRKADGEVTRPRGYLTEVQKRFLDCWSGDIRTTCMMAGVVENTAKVWFNPLNNRGKVFRQMFEERYLIPKNEAMAHFSGQLLARDREEMIATRTRVLVKLTELMEGAESEAVQLKAAETMAKYHGLLVDRVEVDATNTLAAALTMLTTRSAENREFRRIRDAIPEPQPALSYVPAETLPPMPEPTAPRKAKEPAPALELPEAAELVWAELQRG